MPEDDKLNPKPAEKPEAAPHGAQATVAEPAGGHGGRQRTRVDLTTGSIPKKLFSQAWPQVIEGILNIADQFVDIFWAGRLPSGFRAIASIGVAQTFTQFAGQARQGLDVGLRAMIARAVGARDIPLANHVLLQGLILTGIYSFLMVLLGLFATDFFLNLIGASDELRAQTGLYMQIQFTGAASQSFRMATGVALQAAGEPIIPLRATFVSRVIHIVLTPFLIFGWWGLPEMGLAGSALATVLGQVVGIGINLYGLTSGQSRLRMSFKSARIDFGMIGRLLKLSAPASIRGTERATSQLAILAIVTPFGDIALAAYSLTRRLEQLSSFGSGGIAQAGGVMVGQNLGAKQPQRAKQSLWWALAFVAVMKSCFLIILGTFAVQAIRVFTQDAEVVALTAIWVRIQLLAALGQGLMIVYQEAYHGAGDTLAPLIVTLVGVWALEVPLAYYLCLHTGLGPLGIAYAAIVGFTSRAIFFAIYYFSGRWLRIKVI